MEVTSAAAAIHIGQIVVIPVLRARRIALRQPIGFQVHGSVEPRALVVREGSVWRALDVRGRRVSLESLVKDVPGLTEAVEREGGFR